MEILDVGCGFMAFHVKRGTIGIDLHKGLADVVADAHYLPFRNANFDGCYAYALLEHVANPSRVLNEIHYVLKENGWLKILVPTDSRLRADPWIRVLNLDLKGILLMFKRRASERHKWQFSEKSLLQLLRKHKFTVNRVRYPAVPIIYRRKGRTLAKMGFVRHPHLIVHARKGENN